MLPTIDLYPFVGWIGRTTLEASFLVILILGMRSLAGKRWPAAWKASLWLILIFRMMLPGLSLRPIAVPPFAEHPRAVGLGQVTAPGPDQPKAGTGTIAENPPKMALERPSLKTRLEAMGGLLGWLWGAGAVLLGAAILAGNTRLWLAVRRGRVVTAQPVLEVLEACKARLGVRALLCIVETERVPSPALFGLIRPRLLMPPHVLELLSEEELRHVLLHELAHLKRMDLLWAYASSVLLALHWFNPLVWFAFRQMRSDRELACDEAAVRALPPQEAGGYGRTLLKLLETLSPPPRLPMLAGVAEDASNFQRRIQMIARFMQPSQRRALKWSLACSLGLAGVALSAFAFRLQDADRLPPLLPKPIVDRIDYPFVDDPALIGGWRAVDFVKEPNDFRPGARSWKGDLFFKELMVKPHGKTSWAFTWTKDHFLLDGGEKTDSTYFMRTLDGKTFLFFQWKSGDYTYRGMKPSYYVMERDERLRVVESRIEDKIDFPFVDDPAIHGNWRSVDFVRTPQEFRPERRAWPNQDLFLKELHFLPGGAMKPTAYTWTQGLVLCPADRTASRYLLREIEGKTYLFFEWKSGDYIFRGQKPQYYVLTR